MKDKAQNLFEEPLPLRKLRETKEGRENRGNNACQQAGGTGFHRIQRIGRGSIVQCREELQSDRYICESGQKKQVGESGDARMGGCNL